MRNVTSINAVPTAPLRSDCCGCGLLASFLPARLNWQEADEIQRVMEHRRQIKSGQHVFHAGDPLNFLYAVSSGSLKTSISDQDGRMQVTGFSMPGELVGIEAIGSGRYPCNVIALEDSSICGVHFADLEHLGNRMPALQRHLHRVMSREITRDYGLMFLLGNMSAEERIAQFLLNLSARFAAGGYSPSHFRLCMSRRDIACYLGLKVETISRLLTRLDHRQILSVTGKDIVLRSLDGLLQISGDCGHRQSLPAIAPHETALAH